MVPVITISREYGSGGSIVGQLVAEKLGIPFVDREILERAAASTGMALEEIKAKGEATSSLEKIFSSRFYNGLYIGGPQDDIFYAQKDFILDCAKKGPCVIIGRCADYILNQAQIPAIHVFIHADREHRVENIVKYLKFDQGTVAAEKMMDKKDKGRRLYYRYYTDRELGAFENYHVNLDSGALGFETCADLIVAAAKSMSEA